MPSYPHSHQSKSKEWGFAVPLVWIWGTNPCQGWPWAAHHPEQGLSMFRVGVDLLEVLEALQGDLARLDPVVSTA